MDCIILKGGGYVQTHPVAARLRHHYWTGTTDSPRSLVPPPDGGLEKPPGRGKRIVNWAKFMKQQLAKEIQWFKANRRQQKP